MKGASQLLYRVVDRRCWSCLSDGDQVRLLHCVVDDVGVAHLLPLGLPVMENKQSTGLLSWRREFNLEIVTTAACSRERREKRTLGSVGFLDI